MNPRAAINDLLPFQGSPFSRLGTSPSHRFFVLNIQFKNSGEDGIRTHVPLRTNGFQDRLVMTTSIPLLATTFVLATLTILPLAPSIVNNFLKNISKKLSA